MCFFVVTDKRCACSGGLNACYSPLCCEDCVWQGKDYGHSRRKTAWDNEMDLREERIREKINEIERRTGQDFGL